MFQKDNMMFDNLNLIFIQTISTRIISVMVILGLL